MAGDIPHARFPIIATAFAAVTLLIGLATFAIALDSVIHGPRYLHFRPGGIEFFVRDGSCGFWSHYTRQPEIPGPLYSDRAAVTQFTNRFPPPSGDSRFPMWWYFSATYQTTLDGHFNRAGTTFTLDIRLSAIALFSILAFIVSARYPLLRYRRMRRRERDLCEKCGYDLRASTERCPECGKVM
jgi:hypothetical protein